MPGRGPLELVSGGPLVQRVAVVSPFFLLHVGMDIGRALLAATAAVLISAGVRAADTYAVTYQRNVALRLRDGVTLRADIYRPSAEGKFPVLLQRTPYDKNSGVEFGMRAAAHGYVVIIQDVRGRNASEGEWYPFRNEASDGYDTVEWAAALPYANGKVGMFGGSYVGATQMLAAIAHPPHLSGICPFVTASNYHEGWTYQGGAFEQWFNESWTSQLSTDTARRAVAAQVNALNGIWTLPLAEYPLFGSQPPASAVALAPYFLDWLAHPDYDDYWKRISIEEHFSDITVPALHIAAWYDIFLGGSIRNYLGIKARGASDAARRGQRLWIIPGGHAGNGPKIGEVDFGEGAKFDQDQTTLDWYDYLLKGIQNEFAASKPVRLFVLGINQWREEDDWPLARARKVRYFLHSDGKANSNGGRGRLALQSPGAEPADRYAYDPAKPVPTVGGALCCDPVHLAPGPKDQRSVEGRDDVLVYSTPPLAQDLEVTGAVSVELYAQSSALDTDFTAKLVDVWPNGFAQNLIDGILRARYRDSVEAPALLKPEEVVKLTIDLWATSNVFRKGHVVRLDISSSNFPRFDRNPNIADRPYVEGRGGPTAESAMLPATNTVYHDLHHPSALILPVVPGPYRSSPPSR